MNVFQGAILYVGSEFIKSDFYGFYMDGLFFASQETKRLGKLFVSIITFKNS